jgi:hypothetical protein
MKQQTVLILAIIGAVLLIPILIAIVVGVVSFLAYVRWNTSHAPAPYNRSVPTQSAPAQP